MVKAHVEIPWNVGTERCFDKFIKVLEVFEIGSEQIICTCSYDKDLINLSSSDEGIEVNLITEKKPFIRVIKQKELEVAINSDKMLKDLLEISSEYEAMLSINSKHNSNAEIIINDNGHDYINFDSSKYDARTVKAEIKKIAKL